MRLFRQLSWFFLKKWPKYLGAVISLIFVGLLQLIIPYGVEVIIDHIFYNCTNSSHLVIYWLLVLIFVSFVIYILRYIWRVLLFGSAYYLAVELRNKFYKMFSAQFSDFYLRYQTGDLIARVINDVDKVSFAAGEGVLTLIDSLIIGLSIIIIMIFKVDWKLTLLTLSPMPLMVLIIKKNGDILYRYFGIVQDSFSKLSSSAQEIFTNITMIKGFGIENYQSNLFSNMVSEIKDKNISIVKVDARFEPIIYFTIAISNILAISMGSWYVVHHQLSLGKLTSFIMYLGLMVWPMLALAWMFNITERGSAAYDRVYRILNGFFYISNNDSLIKNILLPSFPGVLEVKIYKFYYPRSKKRVLKDVHFVLCPGQILGICGPMGSGKSTILSLIARNFDLLEDDGEIFFHNYSFQEIDRDQWRSRIAVVGQFSFLFSISIAENISLGKPCATEQQIIDVAKLACVHEDILQFPSGYQTVIGDYGGVILSGGQKQRLSIARALILEAEILILDNSLSAVDSDTEYMIFKNLMRWKKNRAIIFCTHRLSLLRDADDILVIENGCINQRGKHNKLLCCSGWYRDMFYYQKVKHMLNCN